MFEKYGEATSLVETDIQSHASVAAYLTEEEINKRFAKFAANLKRIAPKSQEFLYFVSPIITSAEAALLNPDGSFKKTKAGEQADARWEIKGESWKWVSNDPTILPYKNNNGDVFPEIEIIAAHKKWIGCPILVDHRNETDAVRGVILDVYYDRKFKKAIALCAIDKISYPELAHKIATKVSADTSMGTAVAKAICAEANCGRVARTANDFCIHMKTKSGYGEINIGLSPLEISIVTRAADPNAKIRTVFAAAQSIHDELNAKSAEFNSSATLAKVSELEHDLKAISEKFEALKDSMEGNADCSDTAPYGQSSGQYAPPLDEIEQEPFKLNIPERYAYNNSVFIGELKTLRASIEDRLNNLEKTLKTTKEEIMSKDTSEMNKEAYFQGGGGVNEPTPGKVKYPIDPLNEKARHEDKQMVGQKPFPDVGPVDGLHPSPESADVKDELERKKMLARASEVEDRAIRRAAALQKAKENIMTTKEAYFQGGGGVNEPTPGKVKYPIDPLNEHLRSKEDKQMVGQKPFPDVGPVDGLHPSPESADVKDELERKKLIQRASLKARFVRAGNTDGTENLGASGWQVYAKDDSGEKLVFTASVNEISGGRSEALFDVIATKDFGTKMLEKIRSVGIEKAASVYKKSQAVAGPGALPGAPPDASGGAPMPAMGPAAPDMSAAPASDAAPSEDEGGKGDPKEAAMKLAEKARDVTSDLLEAVRTLTGEQSQMGEMEEGLEALPKAAAEKLVPMQQMRADLNEQLISGMKKSIAELTENTEELNLVSQILDSGTAADKDYTNTVVEDVFADAKSAIADGFGLMRAYIKYARGTAGLLKQAEAAERESLLALAEDSSEESDSNDASDSEEDCGDANDASDSEEDSSDANDASDSEEDSSDANDFNNHFSTEGDGPEFDMDDMGDGNMGDGLDMEEGHGHEHEHSMDTNDMNAVMVDVPQEQVANLQGNLSLKPASASAQFDLTTKEGRAAYRAKIANDATGKEDSGECDSAESISFSPSLHDADHLANGQTQLDTKPSDSLGLVETLPEINKRVLEVARAAPKVRQAAERLNNLIAKGAVAVGDLDTLVAKGLDSEVVKYWRQYYGQAGKEGAEFGKMLTTETMKAKQAEENQVFRAKLARAYELSYDMVRRGMLADDRAAITAHVNEAMNWNDDAFNSVARIVARHAPLSIRKEASVIPQVGLIGSGEIKAQAQELDFQSELDRAFANRRY
jgi:hypothetical protein